MANAKWSGIEQWKYGLTADWYVSAKYGYATDEGGWGLYDRDTNPTGWGGPLKPFQASNIKSEGLSGVIVFDTGRYTNVDLGTCQIVGDGLVELLNVRTSFGFRIYNVVLIDSDIGRGPILDSILYMCTVGIRYFASIGSIFYRCLFTTNSAGPSNIKNTCFIECDGYISNIESTTNLNIFFLNSNNLTIDLPAIRNSLLIVDYSIVIGTIKSTNEFNGKPAGDPLTVEDFKADGQYFRKSYSEVDLFGNAEGSGASIAQLNEIFNNFYYPYIDDWQYVDLSLRPDVDDRVRYGGLNGHFIGALPVGYAFDVPTLWNTYQDAANTSNVELNMDNRLIRTDSLNPGVFTTTEITLPSVVDETEVATFFKNNVYDSNGVAVQRLDYSTDPAKDNTLEQRTVYSFRMKTAPDDVAALTDWKEYELDRAPTIDDQDRSNLDPNFDVSTQKKQPIKRFIIEITLRSE